MKFTTLEPSFKSGSSTAITPDFSIYTSAMEVDIEQEHVVRMTGSSTERDLHGDTMAASALADMTAVEPGQTTWLNHDYTLPDSLFGSLLKSPLMTLEVGIADIHIVSDVETSNPYALQTYGYIKKGRRLGCSIGCMVTEFEVDEDNDDGSGWWPPIIILHVLVLEYSVVGIPANQRCWVETATKGLFERSLKEGKGDQALKLAPAVKGLYPRAYQDRLKSVDSESLRRDLERIEVRSAPMGRLEWVPNERTFVMNQKGIYKPVARDEVSTLLSKGVEAPRYPGFAKETSKGFVVPESNVVRDTLTKGASGKTTWPLADEDTAWDKGEAHKRIMDWAGGDDPDWSKVKSVHFWFDDEKADTWGGYKLPFCDLIDGNVKAVPHAIYACTGGHGLSASDIPEEDVPAIKKRIETYYHKMDKKAPWEDEEEKAVEPEKTTDVEPTVKWVELDTAKDTYNVVTNDGTSVLQTNSTSLDLQLYNALAARFGQSQLTLNSSGQIVTPKVEPAISQDAIQDILTKALQIVKSGNEFSQENRDALQSLHDGLVNMCMSSFHPCKEMAMMKDDPEDGDGYGPDGDNDEDDKPDGDTNKAFTDIAAMREELSTLIDTLKAQGHFFDPKAFKDLQGKIEVSERRLKDVQAQAKNTEENIAKLKNTPLGQPTRLNRSYTGSGDVATYQDFMRMSAPTMSANEKRWSLEEALSSTLVISRTLANNEMLNYRKWPEGVGGTVKDGVRPELTGSQRAWMHPMEMVAYNDGGEAAVPCYDDPGGVVA